MKVTLTSMQGNTRNINLMTKQEVYDFIELYKSTLHKNQRVKITCDLLGIDGYLQGVAQQGKPCQCAHYLFYLFYSYMCIIHLTKIFRFLLFQVLQIFSDWGIIDNMGILDNLEGAWDEEFHFESKPIVETNSMGEQEVPKQPS